MPVLRKDKTRDYTVVANDVFQDSCLSLKAKGLMGLAMSLPDDWNFNLRGLAGFSSDGNYAVSSALKELETQGYLTKKDIRDLNGHFEDLEYTFHENPVSTPFLGSAENPVYPVSGFPDPGNPDSGNHEQQNNKKQKDRLIDNARAHACGNKHRPFEEVEDAPIWASSLVDEDGFCEFSIEQLNEMHKVLLAVAPEKMRGKDVDPELRRALYISTQYARLNRVASEELIKDRYAYLLAMLKSDAA
ncbi:MAG: hypothetical protein IJ771_02805 [Clostridia bacterium]|nr:hypothetical protein [Clostridia bacterium]